jgi:alkylation response protein AidB-like acyl-CoA dehydrogenase
VDLTLSREQRQLVETFEALYAKSSSIDVVRSAEANGGVDSSVWARAVEAGAMDMAVDEAHGGGEASLLDLALVAEVHGRHIAPDPLVEAQVTARLLASLDSAVADDLLASALEGSKLITLALRPTTLAGVARMVPYAPTADHVIVHGDGVVRVVSTNDGRKLHVRNIGDLPLADVTVGERAKVLATSQSAINKAIDEWMVLTAAALVGIASRALDIGIKYATERHAFGTVIGAFQAVSHRLADCATAIDGARLLVHEAAWAAAESRDRASELSAMAFAFAAEAARTTTQWSLHFHGGYGFMIEYDIQLYWRRAIAIPALLAEPTEVYRWVAERRHDRERRKGDS